MNTKLFIKDDICDNFVQLQNYIRLITRDSEIYSDILEYGRNGDLSEWLREHGKEALADQINAIDNTASDNEYIKKISLIILDMIPALRKTNFRECFNQNVELAQTQQNDLMLLFSFIPTKDINENYEIKAVCGLETKTISFNPSKFDIGVETKINLVFENKSEKYLDSIIVYIEGEKIYEDNLNKYYFNSKYDFLSKRVYIGSLSGTNLKELIAYHFKIKPVYSISQITASNFAIDDFLRIIYDITGCEFEQNSIVGKTIDDVTEFLGNAIIFREKDNWNSFKGNLGMNDNIDIKNVGLNDLFSLIRSCYKSKGIIKPWDAISTSIDVKRLTETFAAEYNIILEEEEIMGQKRIDNLIMYISNKTNNKQLMAYTPEMIVEKLSKYQSRSPLKSFLSKSDIFNYVKANSSRPYSLSNNDSISETVKWFDLYAQLMIEYGIVLEVKHGTIKDLVNSIWNAS